MNQLRTKTLAAPLTFALAAVFALSMGTATMACDVAPEVNGTAAGDSEIDLIKYLVQTSEGIVLGRVSSQSSYWNEDSSMILTDYHITVLENLARNHGESLTVTAEGGEVGDIGLLVSDQVPLEPGQEYVLYLVSSKGRLWTCGGSLGSRAVDQSTEEGRQYLNALKNELRLQGELNHEEK